MTLAFWNGGSPQRIGDPRQVRTIGGNIILNAVADPSNDIYNYIVVGDRPSSHQVFGVPSHNLVGDTITTTYTNVDRPVSEVRAAVLAQIDAKRNDVAYGGMIALGQDVATDAVSVDTMNLIGSALVDGETLPNGFSWENMQGVRFVLSDAQFRNLRNAAAKHFVLARKQAADHKSAVDALLTFAEIIAYDFSAGWPANPVL